MDEIAKRVQAARSAAGEARQAVAQLSAARLAEIRGMPAKAAAQHLDDPSLTAEDRAALQHWLRQKLPRHRSKSPRGVFALPQELRWIWYFPRLLLLAFGLLVCAGLAWHNTPAIIGTGQTTGLLDIAWPGRTMAHTLKAGTTLGVVDFNADVWKVRVWQPSSGYAVMDIGPDQIQVKLTTDE